MFIGRWRAVIDVLDVAMLIYYSALVSLRLMSQLF